MSNELKIVTVADLSNRVNTESLWVIGNSAQLLERFETNGKRICRAFTTKELADAFVTRGNNKSLFVREESVSAIVDEANRSNLARQIEPGAYYWIDGFVVD